ncbi:hypothetical protein HRR85_005735 [Exophiala dermatitidis]|nr:hypothetical protein HRR79_004776 [Exophiala dermatitidis]KAJ4610481.1 hypothetical protein HRR85_005735 [Exophiala dermatitidis]
MVQHADPAPVPKPAAASVSCSAPVVKFTFVNQAEDLDSLTTRKIVNQEQRHVIRSHVMKSVRQEELAKGKKRSTGREQPKTSNSNKSRSSSNDSVSLLKNESPAAVTTAIKKERQEHEPNLLTIDHKSRSRGAVGISAGALTMMYMPAVHELDPFYTLPCNSLGHQSLERLLRYCFDVLLPLTFSVETKQPRERLVRQGMVLQSKISNPATFLGFMATAAAHRAIFHGNHKDLAPSSQNHDDLITDTDYQKVKHEAVMAVRKKIQRRDQIDHSMIDACFGLIATATVVGNFEEAMMHLKGIKQIMTLVDLDELGQTLKDLLLAGQTICYFCELNATDPRGLSSAENTTLRQKATELEFDLLAYPYQGQGNNEHDGEPHLPSFQTVVRLAALGFLSFAPHTILPSTGLGRALTHHQQRAVQQWLQEVNSNCGIAEMRAVMWALFIFTQNARGQPEEAFFGRLLSQFARDLWLLSWQDIETTIYGFLYIPSLQASVWNDIWAASCKAHTPTRSLQP